MLLTGEGPLQRLFWTFAGGWPGVGLLIQRVTTGVLLLYCAAVVVASTSHSAEVAPAIIGAAAGVLLLLGLWTPLVGSLVAVIETWEILTHSINPLISVVV